jgi:1,4-alpha-glucan branching enzyme
MRKPVRRKVRFELVSESGNRVSVAGTFNNWDPAGNPLTYRPDSGTFATTLSLSPGRYEYKFVVNDAWVPDPNCAESAPNDLGSLNSVMNVPA